ncbi:MAG: hypothetical protein COT74_10405 [Bdellovibrionales bacterium CG10_big_fil_rev_8_21_14_0_10_45_34]|nr:MAG: hypothetical protein COT74_10405 [Bdellovibrionales bacterium CG10_big_fil_rev_8_21_14_0_10_45_34]
MKKLVLIDDDELIRMTWEFCAKQHGREVVAFDSVEAFLIADIPTKIRVYIDYNLKPRHNSNNRASENGDTQLTGYDVAKLLFNKGYQEIYITTGDVVLPERPTYVKAVVGKDFPIE